MNEKEARATWFLVGLGLNFGLYYYMFNIEPISRAFGGETFSVVAFLGFVSLAIYALTQYYCGLWDQVSSNSNIFRTYKFLVNPICVMIAPVGWLNVIVGSGSLEIIRMTDIGLLGIIFFIGVFVLYSDPAGHVSKVITSDTENSDVRSGYNVLLFSRWPIIQRSDLVRLDIFIFFVLFGWLVI